MIKSRWAALWWSPSMQCSILIWAARLCRQHIEIQIEYRCKMLHFMKMRRGSPWALSQLLMWPSAGQSLRDPGLLEFTALSFFPFWQIFVRIGRTEWAATRAPHAPPLSGGEYKAENVGAPPPWHTLIWPHASTFAGTPEGLGSKAGKEQRTWRQRRFAALSHTLNLLDILVEVNATLVQAPA